MLGFSLAKNDANSAQRKRKGYARVGEYPVCEGTHIPYIAVLIDNLQKQPRKSKFL